MKADNKPISVKQILEMPVFAAEKAIDDIAHKKGDEFAKQVLCRLSPVKIAVILRQHDFSSPSIISWMLSPKMIVDVLKIDPLFWMNICDPKNSGNSSQIQTDALELISLFLEHAENRDRQKEMLSHISYDGLSRLYLFLPFVSWRIKKEQTLFIEDTDIDFGTVDYLYETIRWAAPQVAEQIIDFAESTGDSLLGYVTDLWSEAYDQVDPGHDYKSIEAVMFVPLDRQGGSP